MNKKIEYRGVITEVRPGVLQIEISDETACNVCSAQKSCCMSGAREKRIEAPFTSGDYRPGDTVTVAGRPSLGLWAMFFAFLLPSMLIVFTALITSAQGMSEQSTAFISLSALAVYYFGMYFFRHKFNKTFTFTIQ